MKRALHTAARSLGRLTSLLLSALAADAAVATGWDQTLPSTSTAAALPVDVAATNGTRWLLVQLGDTTLLQRQVGSQTMIAATTTSTSRLIALPDGGVLLAENASNRLRRFDAQGQFVWQRDVSPLLVLTDAAGGSWIETGDGLQRLAADGSLRATLAPTSFPVVARTADDETAALRDQRSRRAIETLSGDLLIAGRNSNGPGQGNAQLARFDRQGRLRWTWTDTSATLEFTAVAASAGLSCAAARQANGSSVVRLCFDQNGQQRWQTAQALGPNSAVAAVAIAQDGSLYSLDMINRSGAQLTRLSASGAALWTQTLPAGLGDACAAPGPGCALYVSPNGRATVLSAALSGSLQRPRLLGFSGAGALNYDRELPLTTVSSLTREANGHSLLIGAREAGTRSLVELDTHGTTVAEDTQLSTIPQTTVRALAANPQGDTFVVSAVSGAANYRVRRITAGGQVAWDLEYPGAFDLAQATATNDRVCISEVRTVRGEPDNRVRCIAAADGRSIWTRSIEEPLNFRSRNPLPPTMFRLREDNHLVLSYIYNGVQLYDPSGSSKIHVATTERTPLGDFN
ncbi:MAG: hypothetical protein JNN30_05705, partial [Rhodanobacteraceae bacterium]|nr:hypothetical protein [Rhodanobacteraceae bacterium]